MLFRAILRSSYPLSRYSACFTPKCHFQTSITPYSSLNEKKKPLDIVNLADTDISVDNKNVRLPDRVLGYFDRLYIKSILGIKLNALFSISDSMFATILAKFVKGLKDEHKDLELDLEPDLDISDLNLEEWDITSHDIIPDKYEVGDYVLPGLDPNNIYFWDITRYDIVDQATGYCYRSSDRNVMKLAKKTDKPKSKENQILKFYFSLTYITDAVEITKMISEEFENSLYESAPANLREAISLELSRRRFALTRRKQELEKLEKRRDDLNKKEYKDALKRIKQAYKNSEYLLEYDKLHPIGFQKVQKHVFEKEIDLLSGHTTMTFVITKERWEPNYEGWRLAEIILHDGHVSAIGRNWLTLSIV